MECLDRWSLCECDCLQMRSLCEYLDQTRAVGSRYVGDRCDVSDIKLLEERQLTEVQSWKLISIVCCRRVAWSSDDQFLNQSEVWDIPTLLLWSCVSDIKLCDAVRTVDIEHYAWSEVRVTWMESYALSCVQMHALSCAHRLIDTDTEISVLCCLDGHGHICARSTHLENRWVSISALIETVTIQKSCYYIVSESLNWETVQSIEIVIVRDWVLDILSDTIVRAYELWPLRESICDPILFDAIRRERFQTWGQGDRSHTCSDSRNRCGLGGIWGISIRWVIFQPNIVRCCKLSEQNRVVTLIISLRIIVRIEFSRNCQTAVVIRSENSITIIEVVEIHSHLSVCIEIETDHHVLWTLIDCCEIVGKDMITDHRVNVCLIVEFVLELLQTIDFSSWDGSSIESDVSVCLCEMLITILTPFQPLIEGIRHFSTVWVRSIQIIVIRIARLEVGEPNRCTLRVRCEQIIYAIASLKPIERVIRSQLIALNGVHNIARDPPLIVSESHCARCLSPSIALIAENFVVWSTEFTQNIDLCLIPLFLIERGCEINESLITICNQFCKLTIIESSFVISLNVLETENIRIALIKVPISLCVEIAVSRRGGILWVLICAEESTRYRVDRGVQLISARIVNLSRSHIIFAENSLQLIIELSRCSIISTAWLRIIDLYGDDIRE